VKNLSGRVSRGGNPLAGVIIQLVVGSYDSKMVGPSVTLHYKTLVTYSGYIKIL
jgi:hypothetical protein